MGRKAKDPEIRKKEFVEAAVELFQTKGFERTSVTDISRKVGVSHGAFFYYYKSKEDIMSDVITVLLEGNSKFVRELAENEKMTAREKLRAIMTRSIDSYKTMASDPLTEYFHSPSNIAFHKDYSKRSRELLVPLFVRITEQGIREGYCEVKYPRETIEYLTYVFEGLDDTFSVPQSNDEYYRKITALELLVTRTLGIKDQDLGLLY